MKKIWIVRADSWWYKFEDKEQAESHYKYLLNNINNKYKQVNKIYLAEYGEDKTPKILEMWKRENEKEMI